VRRHILLVVPPDIAAAKFVLINKSNPYWQSNPDPKKEEAIEDWIRAAHREEFRFRTILDSLNSAGDDDNTSDDHPDEPNDHDDGDGA
jgi:hypothetical protein